MLDGVLSKILSSSPMSKCREDTVNVMIVDVFAVAIVLGASSSSLLL